MATGCTQQVSAKERKLIPKYMCRPPHVPDAQGELLTLLRQLFGGNGYDKDTPADAAAVEEAAATATRADQLVRNSRGKRESSP